MLPADHIDFRDLSYDATRMRQMLDLTKGSLFDMDMEQLPAGGEGWDRLELYIKERSRGPGYVADFVYVAHDLPCRVYGTLVTRGAGLEIAELELFTLTWRDSGEEATDRRYALVPITSDLLRRIPVGQVLAKAQQRLAQDDWREEGITVIGVDGRSDLVPADLGEEQVRAMESAATAALPSRRGRPPLPDELLVDVARAYLRESSNGRGLIRRLAAEFDRPEPTISDWVAAARERGYLSPATPGRRGASPGPRLVAMNRPPSDSGTAIRLPGRRGADPLADLSVERRERAIAWLRDHLSDEVDLPYEARLLAALGLLVVDDDGFVADARLKGAFAEPALIRAAGELLRKAAADDCSN